MGFLPGLCLFTFAYLLFRIYLRNSARSKLPPGPKPWPIVGNIMDVPPKGLPEYQHWLKHKEIYGPISSISVMGVTVILLHDRDAVKELMEKKSLKTSGRPWFEFALKLCNFGNGTTFRPYDDVLRKHRKCMHHQLGSKNISAQYNTVVEAEAGRFLLRLLEAPQNLTQHLRTEAGATILRITYGYNVEPKGRDPLVELIERMMAKATAVLVPLASVVDFIPALQYLPDWFPGTAFKAVAKEVREINQATANVPFDFVKQQMALKSHAQSYVSMLIDQLTDDQGKLSFDDEEVIKWSAVTLFGGGADTTVSSLLSVVLAMLKFPEVQLQAQREIDTLTGGNRLPRLEDRDNLPYINAIVKEALRWFPVVPIGVAHVVDEDIVFREYLIPKGAWLMPAIRWLLHDPQVYADPERFDPTRFLPPRNEADPAMVAFGFGRRICPGRFLADSSLFLTIAQMLATFNISKARDGMGKEIEPRVTNSPGLIDHPGEFPFCITPRSQAHVALIQRTEVDYPWEPNSSNSLDYVPPGVQQNQ